MSLKDLNLKISYGPRDNRLMEFFIPALGESVRYDRAAGYFSSSMLAVAATGVARLITNGGKMRLLCGADLSEEDVEAIRKGEELGARLAHVMKKRLFWPADKIVADRLSAMAWMVATGQLEIKVVLPTDAGGKPLPASKTDCYYHPKEGLFTDAKGNQVGFSGSVNESATALENNYESFMVFNSWDTSPAHLGQIRIKFDRLWEGHEKDWLALPIPEAVRQELLKFRPASAPVRDPLEPAPEETVAPPAEVKVDADQRERIIFQFLRDAPYMPNAQRLGIETAAVRPWPHQLRVVDAVIERFPERFMMCDEVGLGKTIEAGLVIRQLVLSGRVRRALILVPKSILVQWQEELYEKFVLNVPRYDGHTFYDALGRQRPVPAGANPWDAHPIMLASSQLAKRRDRQDQLAEAQEWDLLVVDEAHHARRKDFLNRQQCRPNRLLELLNGAGGRPGLKDKTRGLLLLTATPMQLDPIEVWDLLKVLGMGGLWGASDENFLRYFEELKQPYERADWRFLLRMLGDYFATGGVWHGPFCAVAEKKIGPVEWDQIRNLPSAANCEAVIRQLSPAGQAVLKEMLRRHTPLLRYMFRNTRGLLRKYREKGLLKENIPHRDPKSVWIDMTAEEEELYHRIEEYILDHYQRYEAERKGLGFIMTVYRRRLTSSFYAIAESLKRRLDFLKGVAAQDQTAGLTDDDLEQDDLDKDVQDLLLAVEAEPETKKLFAGEVQYIEDFLADLRALGSDSKYEQLTRDLRAVLAQRDSVLVFTQYADTMDCLRDKLRHVYGGQVACYSGRGGERWDGQAWVHASKEAVKTAFRDRQEIKILLCTEAASEGLNLQTCGVLINYDMPWNPMRVEQRIGRIDRIGQTYPRVGVLNYFYNGTVEADIYRRLDDRISSFENVVGELQPILACVARLIEAAAMATDKRRGQLIAEAVQAINNQVQSAEVAVLNLDECGDDTVEATRQEAVPVSLPELERTVVGANAFKDRFQAHPSIGGAYLLDWAGEYQAVTFNPAVFDDHPNTLRLLSFGSELLADVLRSVDPPAEGDKNGVVARCAVRDPWSLACFYGAAGGAPAAIPSLDQLQAMLNAATEGEVPRDLACAIADEFASRVAGLLAHEESIAKNRHNSYVASLKAEVGQLLIQAAYVELAIAAKPELFDDAPPLDFSEEAVRRLARHKYPFAGALRLVNPGDLCPRSDDHFYCRLCEFPRSTLTKRFEAIRDRLGETLQQLAEVTRATMPWAIKGPQRDSRLLLPVLYAHGAK
jgi:superfamily II DNA or RNA helicase